MPFPILVGIDVSKRWLDAAASGGRSRRLDNDPARHRALIMWLREPARLVPAQLVVEPVGMGPIAASESRTPSPPEHTTAP